MPNAGKKRELGVDPFGELDPHFFLDVEIFLAPNHFDRSFEPGQLRFEVLLVPCKVRVVVGESVCRRYRAVVPSERHVVLEFLRHLELRFLRQTSSEGVFENIVAILVQLGAGLVHRRSRLQAPQALVHVIGSVERGRSRLR